jgi:von Willebrand factor type A domain/Aerotolerance regulator N-terminal
MYFLNLSLFQFVALFGSLSAISVALYLLDRSRRKQIVSTLRFWVAAEQPAVAARRRHIQQPWSLILQLLSMALLLLAIAQLHFGAPLQAGHDHVIVLDTSAWMSARSGNRTLMDLAKQSARQYLRAVPSTDRVMLVRADALATPATAFEPDHKVVDAAIFNSQPGSTALNLDQALAFARHIQSQTGHRLGEIAYVGPGRTAEHDPAAAAPPRNLRLLMVPDAIENCGLRKIGMRRSTEDPSTWEIYVSAHNYGTRPRNVTLTLNYGPPNAAARTAAGTSQLVLQPGADSEAAFEYRTAAAGILGVTLTPHDAFPADDQADLELPSLPNLTVTVYSSQPDLLRPALSSAVRIAAVYRSPAEYRANDSGLVILDRFIPPQPPTSDSIWIDPPAKGSPIPVKQTVTQVPFARWDTSHPAAAGLRTKDFKLESTSVFETTGDDAKIGEVEAGPVIVARNSHPRIVVLGFHPALSAMRYELATPLLFANLLRWLQPDVFRRSEVAAATVGTVKLPLDQDLGPSAVKVTGEDASPLPFTLHDRTLEFFSGAPGSARVIAGDSEYIYSLTLPQLGDTRWEAPADAHRGIPRFLQELDQSFDAWPWLAILGALGLLAEWFFFGRFRLPRFAARAAAVHQKEEAPAEVTR